MKHLNKFLLGGLIFGYILVFPSSIHANQLSQKRVLFINQVRGEECCDPGSLNSLQTQIDAFTESNMQATFVVRYDALLDERYQSKLQSLPSGSFDFGALLEVTPGLAQDSNVEYRGTMPDWYQAQQVFLIGYASDERKRIIDTYMTQFHTVFGFYPKVSTAWMIDAESLQYLKNQYGVELHQITREQWGLDSYTMEGGPFHYPYLADDNWAFMPAQQEFVDQVVIVRQTGSDPLYVYGDTSSAFTTQPNDYTLDGKGFPYFEKLSQTLLDQPHNKYSFLLLGLENSMADQFQSMYAEQINKISQWAENSSELQVVLARDFAQDFKSNYQQQKTMAVMATEEIDGVERQAIWITTPTYRVRLIINNNQPILTDWRLYSYQLTDPYLEYRAQQAGFWVTPFVLGGARMYEKQGASQTFTQRFRGFLQRQFLPEMQTQNKEPQPPENDFDTNVSGWVLPKATSESVEVIRNSDTEVIVTYQDVHKKPVTLTFSAEMVSMASSEDLRIEESLRSPQELNPFLKLKKHGQGWRFGWSDLKNSDHLFGLDIVCTDEEKMNTCKINPFFANTFSWKEFRDTYYPYVFPEVKLRALDAQKTTAYAHNKYPLLGEQPGRVVVIPKDENGFSVSVPPELSVSTEPELKQLQINEQGLTNGVVLVDAYANGLGKHQVTVRLSDTLEKQVNVYFTPNCRTNMAHCILHPQHAWWFMQNKWYSWLRKDQ